MATDSPIAGLTAAQLRCWSGLDKGSRVLRFFEAQWLPCWMLRDAIAYTGLAESDLNANAVGDEGRSVGPVQFFEPTARGLSSVVPWPWDWRANPVAAGWASVMYVSQAVKADPTWKALLSHPDREQRLAAWRVLWRYNPYRNQDLRNGRIQSERAFFQSARGRRRLAIAKALASSGVLAPTEPSNV